MMRKSGKKDRRNLWIIIVSFSCGIIFLILLKGASNWTSTDKFCQLCHVHPHSEQSWRLSVHYDNPSGVVVHCVECHLPPGGIRYYTEKVKTGARDVYGVIFKDTDKINWDERSLLEHAKKYTYEASCVACHQNLFPLTLTREGEKAHLHYSENKDELRCINCHLDAGHYNENIIHAHNVDFGKASEEEKTIYTKPAIIEKFGNYKEYIPNTSVSFEMIAIPGGTFEMGNTGDKSYQDEDENPAVSIKISPFFMGKAEVSWDEYMAFFSQTSSEGRSADLTGTGNVGDELEIDAVSGPTPPWGDPSQGWGKGKRPAITMTHFAARRYCDWLSKITGKKYRLPTEAEWEYAARGETKGPYFFEGNPKKYTDQRMMNKIFGKDTSTINTFIIYEANSNGKTGLPSGVKQNPFGLVNMLGNVSEFCSDYYSSDYYTKINGKNLLDPTGPEDGKEHVIRGGSFKSDAIEVRCAERDHTRHDAWLKTDPQMPKSLWWYSDCNHVGFRVVCEYDK